MRIIVVQPPPHPTEPPGVKTLSVIETGPIGQRQKIRRTGQGQFHRLVLARAGYRCEGCGRTRAQLKAAGLKLTADHVIPVSMGGTDDPTNGRALCTLCEKFSIHPVSGF